MLTSAPLPDRDALNHALHALHPQAMAALEAMVKVNSFTFHAAGVNRVGALTRPLFETLGFSWQTPQAILCNPVPTPPLGHHLILTRLGHSDQRIGLVGHLDTVYTEAEEAENAFHWRPEGERIYGPGIFDMKSGNLVLWMTLAALQRVAPAYFDAVTWVVMFNAAEECLSSDFGPLQRRLLGPSALANLVFEPGAIEGGRFGMVPSRKGSTNFTATAHGRSAHAGVRNEQGANAIVQLAHFIDQVTRIADPERDLTVNVGIIEGGTTVNRVPHLASARLEMRAYDPAVLQEAIDQVQALESLSTVQARSDGYPTRMEITCTRCPPCWPVNPGSEALLKTWQAAGADLDIAVFPAPRGGLSDGNFTWDRVPTLDGLGPAGANAHCPVRSADGQVDQEYLLPATMIPRAAHNARALCRLIAGAGLV